MSRQAIAFYEDVTPLRESSAVRRFDYHTSDATGGTLLDWNDVYRRYMEKRHTCPIWSARVDGRPLSATVYQEGSLWIVENSEFELLTHGGSLSEALDEAKSALAYLRNELVDEPDDNLSPNALRLKAIYRHLEIAP